MKTEQEISKHLDDLNIAYDMPCDCEGYECDKDCEISREMIKASICVMSWILEVDDDAYEEVVREMAEIVGRRN